VGGLELGFNEFVFERNGFERARLQPRHPEPRRFGAFAPEGVIIQDKEDE